MNRKQFQEAKDELLSLAEELGVRKEHLSNRDKEKLLKAARQKLWKKQHGPVAHR